MTPPRATLDVDYLDGASWDELVDEVTPLEPNEAEEHSSAPSWGFEPETV